jgi:hypothetical protein
MVHRNRLLVLASAGLVTLLAVRPTAAQMGLGAGYRSGFYDPATEVTVHGVIEEAQSSSYPCWQGGVQVTLRTDKETDYVRVGPTFFLSENGFSLAKGDKLSVTGSKLSFQGSTILIAREISKDGKTLTLRNPQGFPTWAGPGMAGRGYGRGCRRGCGGCGCGCGCGGCGGPGYGCRGR